ncbi:AfsR family transcriptional regulator [Streptomyces sp. SDr-06]|uniref:AfsR/SARP family transcriptional regulator n=1 Tax=Streptomyces sp. SDr-06 TaxID=2267702 RepID=UPI000DE8241F|nr:BTAD domain-containing putative transcriptional regulator [Streptomyces sp. SDr-06]RCH66365.1 AfsR family transcriptional regulator [Streptomyces sp. SDr-06]
MEFRVLGTVAVATEDGAFLALGPAKRRSLLAMLLLRPNTAVPVERLTEALWDDEPPLHSRTVLQGHVSRLRALFAEQGAEAYGIELATRGPAYVLRLPETLIDAHRFEELVTLARGQRDPGDAVLMLREALALWQGPALTGTVASPPLQAAAHTLEELRLASVEALAEAYGELGEHGRAAAVLRTEAVAHPLREPLSAALMLALSRSGRQSDALEWFHRTRRLLSDELGVDPGPALCDAYATILRTGTPAAAPAEPAAPEPEHAIAVPELLPRRPRGFTGRHAELTALGHAAAGQYGAIALVTGGAGVGKTALAVHWAHERQGDFPDGRLFADLCGYSDTPARQVTVVLREFLLALGVPVQRIPETESGMGALYRSLTADRRMLVVLDNARDSEQVRPLLPGGDHCVTLVTSRDRLGGLVASDAARPVRLDELPAADCTALLAAVLGEDRIAAEPAAAARLAELCDGLPLALRVTAARLAARPQWTLASLAGELADEQRRLGLLRVEDTGVAAALRLTVQQLPEQARRMFRALGLHTGSELDRYTAAALAGCTPDQAATALERLATAHLVVESGPPGPAHSRTRPDSYTLHDLVRLYARALAPEADPDGLARLLDHYLYTGLVATATAEPGSQPCFVPPPGARRPAAVREFEDRQAALAWYEAERATLRGAVAAAVGAQLHDRAWRLVLLQWPLILWRVRDGWVPLLQQALESAELEQELDAQSRTRALLGWVLHEEGRYDEALAQLEKAPDLARQAGDVTSEAIARMNLALILAQYGEVDRAGDLLGQALALAGRARDRSTQMLAHQHLARHHLDAGRHRSALDHAQLGLELGPSPEAIPRRVLLRTSYGEALAGLGRTDEARRQLADAAREADDHGFEEGAAAARAGLTALPPA